MKGEKKSQKKGKSVYMLALCGVLAVSGAVYAGNQNKEKSNQEERDLVDLNETPEQSGLVGEADDMNLGLVSEQDNLAQAGEVENPENNGEAQVSGEEDTKQMADAGTLPGADEQGAGNGPEGSDEVAEQLPESGQIEVAQQDTEESQAVLNPSAADLRFSAEEGLMLPLAGTLLKAYSAEHAVYFETLEQFRTNPAVFLAAESGSEVVAAADGIVTSVSKEDKTGVTVTMNLGDDYRIVYGQLTGVQVEAGDYVRAGEVFANLAEPTKYYSMEGSHLYMQLWDGDVTVDPMTFIN